MQLIDSHAHLDFPDYDNDRELVIERAKAASVGKLINVGADLKQSKIAVMLAQKYPNVWATVGIHPEEMPANLEKDIEAIDLLAKEPRVVAIGECGLDYSYDKIEVASQKELFKLQIDLAKKENLPLILHLRNGQDEGAARDAYEILKNEKLRGVVHCFTMDKHWAKRFLDLGYYLGFTGIITFKNAEAIREVVQSVPLDRILVETDCPFLAPQRYRGQRNEPSYVVEVAEKVAELKSLSITKVAECTTKNVHDLFSLDI